MYRFNVSDRVVAAFPEGDREVVLVEGFVTGIEQEGRLVAIRPATPEELESGEMLNPCDTSGSHKIYGDQVYLAEDIGEVIGLFFGDDDGVLGLDS